MDEFDDFDPALFGVWESAPVYGESWKADGPVTAASPLALEIKSAASDEAPTGMADELRQLLNEMTAEMRDQFSTFRRMRELAETALTAGDDAAGKLARADIKAATDAMSLIVRTLEKVDALQRQLARDREAEADRTADEGGYGEAKARLMQLISDRAHEQALALFETWQRDGPPGQPSPGLAGQGDKQEAVAAGDRENGP